MKARTDVDGLSARPEDERVAWTEVVYFYAGGLSTKDAVFDAGLVATSRTLADAPDSSDLADTSLGRELAATLRLAAPIYRAVWWPAHERANLRRRDELQRLVDAYGARAVTRLTTVYGTVWPDRPRVIDLVAYSNWAGAYSTQGGLIVLSSTDEGSAGSLGLESLLHESSHQWDEEVERRLAAIAAKRGKRLPDALSHALIFYTAGEIVAELVPGHVPYAVKFDLWTRGSFAPLKPLLDQYWRPYLRGTGSFDEAAGKLAEAVK